jgi:hypothetical protein
MFRKSPWHILNTRSCFYSIAVIGFIFKYWLVLGEEIEPFYRPADDLNYVLLAKSWYWWADYNAWTFLRPPVFPLYLGLVNISELPLRIVQELLLCWATYFLINRFRKNGINATVAGVVFVVMIHHPGWLLLANRTLRECFYTTLLLILVAQLVPLANRKLMSLKWHHLLPIGFTSAFLWHTREEAVLIAGLLSTFVVVFWLLGQELPRISKTIKQLSWVLLGIAGPIFLTNLVIRSANYATHGLFIPHEFSGVAFSTLQKQLMQIKPLNPKPWVSVEQESLEKAYAVSPTLASIREALSERVGPRWAKATIGQTQDEKEIAGSAIFFAIREAAMEEGIHQDAVTADAFYRNVSAELDAAFNSGKLEKRFTLSGYIDPEYSDFLPRVPKGIIDTLGYSWRPLKDTDIRIYYPRHNVFSTLDAYDEVTNRRHTLAYRKVTHIRGWAFLVGQEITHISVIDHNGIELDATAEITPRPDVQAAFSTQEAPLNSGFTIALPKADYPDWDVKIQFHTADGKTTSMQAKNLLSIGQQEAVNPDGALLRVTIDEVQTGKADFALQESIQSWLWLNHGKFHLALGGIALLVLLYRYALYEPYVKTRHFYRWILFLTLVFMSRWFLITLMDVSSFRIDLRYIFPAIVFLPLLFALVLQEALAGMNSRHSRF